MSELLDRLPPDDRSRVIQATVRRRYKRGETIFLEGAPGDTLHLLQVGRVAIRASTPLGDVATLAVLGAGDHFGDLALTEPAARRTASAIALEPVETLTLNAVDFDDLRRRNPSIERFLVLVLSAQVKRLSAQLVDALYVPAERRVIRRLAELAAIYDSGEPAVEVPLSQADLATLAGTTRPTTNRILRRLETDGVVTLERGRTVIGDPTALQRLAASST